MENMQIIKLKKIAIIFALLAIPLAILFWFYNHAYIEVTITDASNKDTVLHLLNQQSGDSVSMNTSNKTIKKMVKRSSYEVTLKSDSSSYFSVIKTGGFLSTTKIQTKLSKENDRKFVGDNPAQCMHYDNNVLISFVCGTLVENANYHIPASTNRPTYVQKIGASKSGSVQGIVLTVHGNLSLIRAPKLNEDGEAPYTIYNFINGKLEDGVELPDLDTSLNYSIKPYRDGFLIYDSSFNDLYYYSSKQAKPEPIKLSVKNPKLSPYLLNIRNKTIVVAYFENDSRPIDYDEPPSSDIKTEVVVYSDGSIRNYVFNSKFSELLVCGDNKLCGLVNNKLDVYDIGKDKPRRLYSVTGISSIKNFGSKLLAVRDSDILLLDADNHEGYSQYSLSGYKYCGIQINASSYVVCLINNQQFRVALHIDPSKPVTSTIDKQILDLQKLGEIKKLSVYGSFIHISPNLGEVTFDSNTGFYGYDSSIKQSVNSKINEALKKSGIDLSKYTVVNTLQ